MDGVTTALTSHDRDLWFDGVLHRASPGMVPSAIRRTADLSPDSAEVQGALTHDSISPADLAAGRFDGASIEIGLVDWETLEQAVIYHGRIGGVAEESAGFQADLQSMKEALQTDPVPRTSPTCRAQFCGPGCGLSPVLFTHEAQLSAFDVELNTVQFADGPPSTSFENGKLRWIDGPHAGQWMEIMSIDPEGFMLNVQLAADLAVGTRALLREGCDHTLDMCHDRFRNAVNFRGEPFLPGNDLLARYPQG